MDYCFVVKPMAAAHVVETTQGQGALELALQANKRVTHAYSSHFSIQWTKQ